MGLRRSENRQAADPFKAARRAVECIDMAETHMMLVEFRMRHTRTEGDDKDWLPSPSLIISSGDKCELFWNRREVEQAIRRELKKVGK